MSTRVTNIAHLIDLTPYAPGSAADYDMAAVNADFLARLNADLFDGITVTADGDVHAEPRMLGVANQLDWHDVTDGVDTETIWEQCALPAT